MKHKLIARLELENGMTLPLEAGQFPYRIGRSPDCSLCVPYSLISRVHCELVVTNNQLFIRDTSTNGTLIGNRMLTHEDYLVSENTTMVLGLDCLIRIRVDGRDPYDDYLKNHEAENGIAIVDICDSTERTSNEVDDVCRGLRNVILQRDSNNVLLLKNTGDGFLIVYARPKPLLSLAKRLLTFQLRRSANFDLRVTLEAGKTIDTSTSNDLLGEAINRATRLEKTQDEDLIEKGRHASTLKPRNRCLISANYRKHLTQTEKRSCIFIGKTKFKGFGGKLHSVYQYNF